MERKKWLFCYTVFNAPGIILALMFQQLSFSCDWGLKLKLCIFLSALWDWSQTCATLKKVSVVSSSPRMINSCPSTRVSPLERCSRVIQWCISSGVSALQCSTRFAVIMTKEFGLRRFRNAYNKTREKESDFQSSWKTEPCAEASTFRRIKETWCFLFAPLKACETGRINTN